MLNLCGIVVAILKMVTGRNLSMSGIISGHHNLQGFQSGPVPGTFTRLRSCIVPAEITEPPKISGGQNYKYDRLVEYFS
jgi:hypothetical protein